LLEAKVKNKIFQINTKCKQWEKVTTTNFTTSKTKKNIEKFANHHYIESHFLVYHYYYNQNIENGFLVGEQTYCRKQHFDKIPKAVLGNFAENIFQE
jgi:hypothetical protein